MFLFFWGAGFVLFQIASGVDVVVVGADVCVESGSGIDDANRCEQYLYQWLVVAVVTKRKVAKDNADQRNNKSDHNATDHNRRNIMTMTHKDIKQEEGERVAVYIHSQF